MKLFSDSREQYTSFSFRLALPSHSMGVKLRGRSLYNLMKFVSGMSFCMYGYDASVLGGMLLHPPFQEAMGNPTAVWTYPMIIAT